MTRLNRKGQVSVHEAEKERPFQKETQEKKAQAIQCGWVQVHGEGARDMRQ